MPRTYERSLDLPPVDIPDWDLLTRLDELFRQHGLPDAERTFEATDSRGTYSEPELESLRREVERADETPTWVTLRLLTTNRYFVVHLAKDWSRASFSSADEAVVVHLAERTRDLFEKASARRTARLQEQSHPRAADAAAAAERRAVAPAADVWWRRYATEIVVGVVTTVIGGLILAVILGVL